MLGRLGDLARVKNRVPRLASGMLGCMAQHNRAALIEKAPYLDLIAGPDSYRRLPEMLAPRRLRPVVDVRLDRAETYADITPDYDGPAFAPT